MIWGTQALNWAQTIVGAGLGTALVQPLITLYRDRRKKKSQASYTAVRLAVILEEFVVKCIFRAWHDQADLAEGAHKLSCDLPALASYPQDLNWKSLDSRLAGQALAFPNEIASASMSCQFQGLREGNSVASLTETIIAGVSAWMLAQALRKKYSLDKVTIRHVEFLQEEHEKIQQQRAAFQRT
jgi:hypothetical protein